MKSVISLFLIGIFVSTHAAPIMPKAKISMHFNEACKGDTIHILVNYFKPMGNYGLYSKEYRRVVDPKGNCSISVELIGKYAYLYVARDVSVRLAAYVNPLVDNYLIEAGDDIQINVKYDSVMPARRRDDTITYGYPGRPTCHIDFSGKGADKFKLYEDYAHHRDLYALHLSEDIPVFNKDGSFNANNSEYRKWDYIIDHIIDHFKAGIDQQALSICRADMVGDALYNLARGSQQGYGDPGFLENAGKANFRKVIEDKSKGIEAYAKVFSRSYADGVFEAERTDCFLSHDYTYNIDFYNVLKNGYSGELRDKLITMLLTMESSFFPDPASLAADAKTFLTDSYYYGRKIDDVLKKEKGAPVYNFHFPGIDGKVVNLSDFRNKVVLIDFYFLGCHACSGFYEERLKYVEEHFKDNKDVVFVIVSVDAEKDYWRRSLQSGLYTSTDKKNVINLYTAGLGFKHPMLTYYQITGFPCPLLVDKQGKFIQFDGDLSGKSKEKLIEQINMALEDGSTGGKH